MTTLLLIALFAMLSILLGGLFALRFKDKLHLILGFSAGSVIGVAFFDLLPEALELGGAHYDISVITSVVALGFILYTILDRFVFLHSHDDEHDHGQSQRGAFGAGSLSLHSFLDGAAVGLAFHVSASAGMIVAIAVIVHGFSDGINTVNLILKNSGSRIQAFKWLLIDALAPVAGIFSTLFFTVPEASLGLILAIFCGFFLYIGASDLLPESHHRHPTYWTTGMTALGALVIYIAIQLVHV